MTNENATLAGDPQAVAAADSHAPAQKPSRKPALFDAVALQQKASWSVPETAFMCGVGVRTVWRELSDTKSKFPRACRIRGRTVLSRDAVLSYLAGGGKR